MAVARYLELFIQKPRISVLTATLLVLPLLSAPQTGSPPKEYARAPCDSSAPSFLAALTADELEPGASPAVQ